MTPTKSTSHQPTPPSPKDPPPESTPIPPPDNAPTSPPSEPSTSSPSQTAPTSPTQDDLLHLLQRTRADFENFRKRTDEQKLLAIQIAREDTIKSLLPLLDTIYLAIASHPDQLAPVQKTFHKSLQDLGLALIPSTPGTPFDPNLHDAITMEDSGGSQEIISATLRPGYLLHNATLRPAMVKVKTI